MQSVRSCRNAERALAGLSNRCRFHPVRDAGKCRFLCLLAELAPILPTFVRQLRSLALLWRSEGERQSKLRVHEHAEESYRAKALRRLYVSIFVHLGETGPY